MHNTIRDRVRFIPNDGCESEVARANEKTAFANIILAAACNFWSVLPADRETKKIDTNSDCVSEKKSILYVGLL